MGDAREITILQWPKFKAEATEIIGVNGIEDVAAYLVDQADAGVVIPGAGGARKLRWAARGQADLAPDEVKALRQIAAHLKGVH